MKKLKRILSVLLAALMLVGTVPAISAANVTFTDVSSHWAWKDGYIPYLTEKGVINGIKQSDGTYMFKPENAVTRAQFVKMMVETFGLTDTVEIDYDNFVPDEWYYSYFEKAAAQGFLVNYGKSVNPNAAITREEAVALMVRYLDIPASESADEDYFTDTAKISSWYKTDVLLAVGAGIIDGIKQKDGTYMFKPQNTLTRAQALTIIYKAAGCIFDGSAYSRDGDAHSVNNTINKGNISIFGVTFSGRNIITEGADDGKITLADCKINGTLYVRGSAELVLNNTTADEIIVYGGGKVTFKNSSKVETLTLDAASEIDLTSGSIGTLNIKASAPGSAVSGKGTIEKAVINAQGFNSAIMPSEYTIANGVEALIAGRTLEGSSDTGEAFVANPYATSDGSYYAVNVLTGMSGTVRLYYTNDKSTPTNSEFDTIYSGSKYKFSFTVKANEATSKNTVPDSTGSKYKYVVVQLVSGPTKYKPVVISNAVLNGDGFNTDPEFIARTYDISIDPESNGTVYWYYSDNGTIIGQSEFLQTYNNKESAFKGSLTVKKDTETLIAVNSIYAKNYAYICLMAADANGNYYTPVVVSIGESDFVEAPALGSKDTIVFTPAISGTLYYYFSKNASLPSKTDYIKKYNSISYHNKVTATANVESSFSFNSDLLEGYPYIIFALADKDGNFSQPVALYAYSETGFTSGPNLGDGNTIEFTPEADGYVAYYYSAEGKVPEEDEFMEIYEELKSYLKGSTEVEEGKKTSITYNADYITGYPYMIMMFISDKNVRYFPTVVSLKDNTDYTDVYASAPVYNGSDKVTLTSNFDGYVYSFYTDSANSVSASGFYNAWKAAEGTETRVMANIKNVINISSSNTYRYLMIGFSHTDEIDGVYIINMVAIDLEKAAGPEKLTGNGLSYSIISSNVFVTPKTTGTLYYYKTNSSSELPSGDFMTAYNNASEKGTKSISSTAQFVISPGAYKYLVLCMKNMNGSSYAYVVIDTTTGTSYDDSQPTITGISRDSDDIANQLSGCIFSFTAEVEGTMNISYTIGGTTVKITSFAVAEGGHYEYNFTTTIQTIKNLLDANQVPLVKFNFQITNGNTEYQVYTMGISEFR